jgi:hypothetical protein
VLYRLILVLCGKRTRDVEGREYPIHFHPMLLFEATINGELNSRPMANVRLASKELTSELADLNGLPKDVSFVLRASMYGVKLETVDLNALVRSSFLGEAAM